MNKQYQLQSIAQWANEDRPREKMLSNGLTAVTDAELIAILIGSGTVGESAVSLAQRILASVENNLHELGKRTTKDLQRFRGVGEAKTERLKQAGKIFDLPLLDHLIISERGYYSFADEGSL
jgi:DNA repair protein RadC